MVLTSNPDSDGHIVVPSDSYQFTHIIYVVLIIIDVSVALETETLWLTYDYINMKYLILWLPQCE